MILAFHSIISCYGFWLPNEPRGSWSSFVASWELFRFGPATKVQTHRSVAHRPYNRAQAKIVGQSLQLLPYVILALAIMPDHLHAVIAHTERNIRKIVGHIKAEATRNLRAESMFLEHSPWADHGWNVYLDSVEDVLRAIEYVNNNPIREGLPIQRWNCVVSYIPGISREARRKRRG
jgi:REP element-mobilizing transposase RayT